MLDQFMTLNKKAADWQMAQMKLANKATVANLNASINAWEATAAFAATSQQDLLNSFKPAAK